VASRSVRRLLWLPVALLACLTAAAQDRRAGITEVLLEAARAQVGVTVIYDGRYTRLRYPGGDVPMERGVCTDVLVRAYRKAGIDLQALVHEDMTRAFGAYPHLWGLRAPDSNIDHRRVQNLRVFFARHGKTLPVTSSAKDYQPGDIVVWRLSSGQPHIGLVSSRTVSGGNRPLVIHNVGQGAQEEDALFLYAITGHYRYP
jgi:uncharacterized protein